MPSSAAPTHLRFEHHPTSTRVLGLGVASPRLSWWVPEAPAGWLQRVYEVEVSRDGQQPKAFRVSSSQQVLVPWPGAALMSRAQVAVRVRVAGGEPASLWSDWSEVVEAEVGLLDGGDWAAKFISPCRLGGLDMPAPVLRGVVDLPEGIASARLRATAHGVYVAHINDQRVGDEVLAPGWTSYKHRLRYQTHDVTDLVTPGANVIEALLGNGWYRGHLAPDGLRAHFGDRLAFLAQLEITTSNGELLVFGTDESWAAHAGAIVADDLYNGQRTDFQAYESSPPHVDHVEVVDADFGRLVAPEGPPVRVTQEVAAASVTATPSGAVIVDFGQNLVGWVRLRVRGHQPGHEVTVRHAEVLEHGQLGVRPLRAAQATDSYVLAAGTEVLEPCLTFHGFRYAEVTGLPALGKDDVTAMVVGSDLPRTGWFDSSDSTLNRFHENVVWGMRGNFLDVPTDCPQRDERLGWTGDIQIFAPTAAFLFDTAGFLSSWLADLAAEQDKNGFIPVFVPDVPYRDSPPRAAAAWGDAATVVPSVLYERTGDLGVLQRQLPSMVAWVNCIAGLAGPDHLWTGGFQFGDWLDPTAPPDEPSAAKADPDVIATAHLARSADLVARAALALGEATVAEHHARLAAAARAAFAREFVSPAGRVLSDAATVYALALQWDLLPTQEQRAGAGRRLADLVRSAGFRISTGFVGTPVITDALTTAGELPTAYRLLMQTGCPSWLYSVTMGATTVWERYDSMLPDGTIHPGEMTSFNHYALGAVADWLHRCVAGLAPAAPGYRHIAIKPQPGGGLTSASARHLTPYGEASSSWTLRNESFTLSVRVPVGATAQVYLPGSASSVEVAHGEHTWQVALPSPADVVIDSGSSIRALMDDPERWRQLVSSMAVDESVDAEVEVARRLSAYLSRPLTELPEALAGFLAGPVEQFHPDRLERTLARFADTS